MSDSTSKPDFIDQLKTHALFHQATDEQGLRKHLATGQRMGYAGFDPTAHSFTIGNLVPMMLLRHFQVAGHTPVIVCGGGTGLIGDPSGKSAERTLMTEEKVRANVENQQKIFSKVIDFSPGKFQPLLVNNLDWLGKLGFLQVLRDVGKHFSVNEMVKRDSVRTRLEERDQGISYTEFSYMILQAYDFYHLHQEHGVTLQMGGSDQWGNIVAGADLIRRMTSVEGGAGAESFGITNPLITKADGGKFGKTESGAVWMTPEETSPYAYYQFWLNASDADVTKFLRVFTFLPGEQLDAILERQAADPGAREAQRVLAREATTILHGKSEMDAAEAAAKALFSGDLSTLNEATLREVFAEVPSSQHAKAQLEGEGVALVELLKLTGLAASNREAKEFLQQGSVTVNGRKVGAEDRVRTNDLLHGATIALRRGKKNWHITRWA